MPTSRRRAGRLTRNEKAAREREVLSEVRATNMFLERGFGRDSIGSRGGEGREIGNRRLYACIVTKRRYLRLLRTPCTAD